MVTPVSYMLSVIKESTLMADHYPLGLVGSYYSWSHWNLL